MSKQADAWLGWLGHQHPWANDTAHTQVGCSAPGDLGCLEPEQTTKGSNGIQFSAYNTSVPVY